MTEIKATKCQCEQAKCGHSSLPCMKLATHRVKTPYGIFAMCIDCATNMWNYLSRERHADSAFCKAHDC